MPALEIRQRTRAHTPQHFWKYNDRMELAKPLGAWMARAGNELLVEADLLVPVPSTAAALPRADSIRRTP